MFRILIEQQQQQTKTIQILTYTYIFVLELQKKIKINKIGVSLYKWERDNNVKCDFAMVRWILSFMNEFFFNRLIKIEWTLFQGVTFFLFEMLMMVVKVWYFVRVGF